MRHDDEFTKRSAMMKVRKPELYSYEKTKIRSPVIRKYQPQKEPIYKYSPGIKNSPLFQWNAKSILFNNELKADQLHFEDEEKEGQSFSLTGL